jgi:hypothetical protein
LFGDYLCIILSLCSFICFGVQGLLWGCWICIMYATRLSGDVLYLHHSVQALAYHVYIFIYLFMVCMYTGALVLLHFALLRRSLYITRAYSSSYCVSGPIRAYVCTFLCFLIAFMHIYYALLLSVSQGTYVGLYSFGRGSYYLIFAVCCRC